MQILEISAIANLAVFIAVLIILPILKPICSVVCYMIPFIYIYHRLKSEKKRLETKAPQENEYFVLCCKADKEFLKNITDNRFISVHSMKELKKKLRKIIK